MADNTRTKTVMIGGKEMVLYSIDGETWSSDLRQLERRMKQREAEEAKILSDAKKFFKSRPLISEKSRL